MRLRSIACVPCLPTIDKINSLICTNVIVVMIMTCYACLYMGNAFNEVISCIPTGYILEFIPSSWLCVPYTHIFHGRYVEKDHTWSRISVVEKSLLSVRDPLYLIAVESVIAMCSFSVMSVACVHYPKDITKIAVPCQWYIVVSKMCKVAWTFSRIAQTI